MLSDYRNAQCTQSVCLLDCFGRTDGWLDHSLKAVGALLAILATWLKISLSLSRSLEWQIQGSLLELNFSSNTKLPIKTYLKVSKKDVQCALLRDMTFTTLHWFAQCDMVFLCLLLYNKASTKWKKIQQMQQITVKNNPIFCHFSTRMAKCNWKREVCRCSLDLYPWPPP